MKNKNSKRDIYTPIVLSLMLAAGIIIGNKIIPNSSVNYHTGDYKSANKINSLFMLIGENYVDNLSIDSLEEIAIPKILDALDPHTVYIPAVQMEAINEPLEGKFDGIGVQFNIQNDTILIINTISGGPSEKIGVLAGDRIITINDSLFAGIGITNTDIIKNLKGKKGTTVKVGIKRNGIKDLIYFEITRGEIPLYSVDISYMLDETTGYIKISNFSRTTHDEFLAAAIKLLNLGMNKLVLDLRQNGGGYLDVAVNIADEFIEDGRMIVYTDGETRRRIDYKASENGICEDIELSVLIDSWSASASEIIAGAIQDNDRGTIIGRRSFGKGLVQESHFFPDGSGIRLTVARYYTPAGRCIQKPYSNGNKEYFTDIFHRDQNGELNSADSTVFNDSLKYTTTEGRTVYGGGGIMPDIFVAVDTSDFTDYYYKLISEGLIYKFALEYTDKHRHELQKINDYKKINNNLLENNVFDKFIAYASRNGIKHNAKEIKISEKIISARLRAFIARNIIDDKGFYPIIREIDDVLDKAVENFK